MGRTTVIKAACDHTPLNTKKARGKKKRQLFIAAPVDGLILTKLTGKELLNGKAFLAVTARPSSLR